MAVEVVSTAGAAVVVFAAGASVAVASAALVVSALPISTRRLEMSATSADSATSTRRCTRPASAPPRTLNNFSPTHNNFGNTGNIGNHTLNNTGNIGNRNIGNVGNGNNIHANNFGGNRTVVNNNMSVNRNFNNVGGINRNFNNVGGVNRNFGNINGGFGWTGRNNYYGYHSGWNHGMWNYGYPRGYGYWGGYGYGGLGWGYGRGWRPACSPSGSGRASTVGVTEATITPIITRNPQPSS